MDVDLKELSVNILETLLHTNFTALFDLQNEATPDQKKIKNLKDLVAKLTSEIKERESKMNETKSKDTGGLENSNSGAQPVANRDFMSHKIKTMSSTVSTEIPVFSSGHDVHIWLTKIDSYHKLFVVSDSTGVMKEHFLQVAKSRLCPEYLNAMMASNDDTSTYAGMKEYMKKHHASKVSVFQVLDTIWEMDKTESETLRDYGIRLDDKAAEARSIIEAKFKDHIKNDVSRTDKVMKVDDVFRLMSGQVFLQALKNKKQTIYNNVCNDLDSTWSAAEIANKAMTFSDRMTSENGQNQADTPKVFTTRFNKPSDASRTEICYYFLKGNCRNGRKCKRIHDERAQKMFSQAKTENNGQNENSRSDSGTFGSKPNKEDAVDQNQNDFNGSNQHQRYAVHAQPAPMEHPVTGMPMLPLPTQDFRI